MDSTAVFSALSADPLLHAATLKALALYGDRNEVLWEIGGDSFAGIVCYPTKFSAWNSMTYPESDCIALPVSTPGVSIRISSTSRRSRMASPISSGE